MKTVTDATAVIRSTATTVTMDIVKCLQRVSRTTQQLQTCAKTAPPVLIPLNTLTTGASVLQVTTATVVSTTFATAIDATAMVLAPARRQLRILPPLPALAMLATAATLVKSQLAQSTTVVA